MKPLSTTFSLNDPIWVVRIVISMQGYSNIADETVYYRCRMPYDFLCRWLWYFEYLQALIKVAHPLRVVSLEVGRMPSKMRVGKEFIDYRRAILLKSRQKKLDELVNTPYLDDLFGFTSQDVNQRIEYLKAEITSLQRGEVTFPVLEDYINKVKKWIQ